MDHLVHYAIGNDYAASEYARLHAPDFLDDLTSLADEVVDEGLIEKALHRMGEASAPNGRNLTLPAFPVGGAREKPAAPFEPSMLQRDANRRAVRAVHRGAAAELPGCPRPRR